MKATCPNNSDHKEFITTAHVMQDWKVDEHGNFIEIINDSVEVSAKPNAGNIWTCSTCGTEAVVVE